jgi:hypothetical protein
LNDRGNARAAWVWQPGESSSIVVGDSGMCVCLNAGNISFDLIIIHTCVLRSVSLSWAMPMVQTVLDITRADLGSNAMRWTKRVALTFCLLRRK